VKKEKKIHNRPKLYRSKEWKEMKKEEVQTGEAAADSVGIRAVVY
jgi:hypothetical protein